MIYKMIPADLDDLMIYCKYKRDYDAYLNICRRINTITLPEELKLTYTLKFIDISIKYEACKEAFEKKYFKDLNKQYKYKLDLANQTIFIMPEEENAK